MNNYLAWQIVCAKALILKDDIRLSTHTEGWTNWPKCTELEAWQIAGRFKAPLLDSGTPGLRRLTQRLQACSSDTTSPSQARGQGLNEQTITEMASPPRKERAETRPPDKSKQ